MHEADIPYYQQEVDVLLHDGDIIQIGDTVRLEVLHTPGHTPGGSVTMQMGSFLQATPFLWATAAAPTCPTGIDQPWAHQSAGLCNCLRTPLSCPGTTTAQLPHPPWGRKNARISMRKNMDSMRYKIQFVQT